MKKAFLLAVFAYGLAVPAFAQIEPRMAGDWQTAATDTEPAKSWHLGADGRYQTVVDGKVVDSGRMTARDGSWKMQSDRGQTLTGTFSLLGGKLQMGGDLAGSWSHGAPSSIPMSSKPLPTSNGTYKTPNYSTPLTKAPTYTTPSYSTPATSGAAAGISDVPASPPYAPGHEARNLPGYSPEAHASAESQKEYNRARNEEWRNRPAPPGVKDATAEEYEAYRKSGTLDFSKSTTVDKNGHRIYTVEDQLRDHPQTVYRVNANDIMRNAARNSSGRGAAYENGTFEHNDALQQTNRGMAPGWRPVPRGGYIPVMKDNKARSFWRGF
jgi:hypothetical protein